MDRGREKSKGLDELFLIFKFSIPSLKFSQDWFFLLFPAHFENLLDRTSRSVHLPKPPTPLDTQPSLRLSPFLTLELQQNGREPLLANESEWNDDPLFLHGHLSSLSVPLCVLPLSPCPWLSHSYVCLTLWMHGPMTVPVLAGRVLQSGSMFGAFWREALTAWDLRSSAALRRAKEALWVQSRDRGQTLSLVFLSGLGLWTQLISTSRWPPSKSDLRSLISRWEGSPNGAYDLNWKLRFQF